jgi:hypothetical protein
MIRLRGAAIFLLLLSIGRIFESQLNLGIEF